jgi:hypothetical protein
MISPVNGKILCAHPNAHSVPKKIQLDTVNNWDRMITGINENGRPVDIFWKNDLVVVTHHGDKTARITCPWRIAIQPAIGN